MKKMFKNISGLFIRAKSKVDSAVQDVRGDLATNTIGAIIIAVVVIGLLVVAINAFFPGFFTRMFNSMQNKLNANW